MYACMCMYDVLVDSGGRGKEREGLKAGDEREEGESTSLTSYTVGQVHVCIHI